MKGRAVEHAGLDLLGHVGADMVGGSYRYENRLYSQASIARRTSTGFSVMGQ